VTKKLTKKLPSQNSGLQGPKKLELRRSGSVVTYPLMPLESGDLLDFQVGKPRKTMNKLARPKRNGCICATQVIIFSFQEQNQIKESDQIK